MNFNKLKKMIPPRIKHFLISIYERTYSIKSNLKNKYNEIYIRTCRINKRKVVFDNFGGKGYGDNPKYIAEEILQQKLDWDLVWLVNNEDYTFPKGIRAVKYGSDEALREMASTKFFVDNIRNSIRPPKRKKQIYIQTWHAGLGFKYVEGAVEDKLDKNYVQKAKEDGNNCDAIISECKFLTNDYHKYFWLNPNTEILEFGLPRNDALFNKELIQEKYKSIREELNIPYESKIILYMPTFRDDFSIDGYALNFDCILSAMEERFGGSFVFVIKLHPNVECHSRFIAYNEKIINGSQYSDPQEMYFAADFLITDYSSAPFDFSLLHRPVFLCALDYEKYMSERGLHKIYDICPFPHSYSNAELINNIKNFDNDMYWSDFDNFLAIWQPFDNGNAARKTVEWMKSKL